MTETIIATIVAAALAGTGGIIVKYCLDRNQDVAPQEAQMVVEATRIEHPQLEQSIENVVNNILEDHAQRESEDSDTEINIHVHTHHKEKDDVINSK